MHHYVIISIYKKKKNKRQIVDASEYDTSLMSSITIHWIPINCLVNNIYIILMLGHWNVFYTINCIPSPILFNFVFVIFISYEMILI